MNKLKNILLVIFKILKIIFNVRNFIVFIISAMIMAFLFNHIQILKKISGYQNVSYKIICYMEERGEIEKYFGKIIKIKYKGYEFYFNENFLIEECAIMVEGDKRKGIIYAKLKHNLDSANIEKINIKIEDRLINVK